MPQYKIDYERINELYPDPDQRVRVLRQAKERVGRLNLEEAKLWFENFAKAYFKSRAYGRSMQVAINYIRKHINWQAREKIKTNSRFNQIKITKSAYEKARYTSKRVVELNKKNLEIKFYPIYDKGSDIISDFYIPFQRVDNVSCWTNSGAGVLYATSIRKESYGWAHSHANLGIFHSGGDDRFTKNSAPRLESILDFYNSDKEKNRRFNFRASYIPSLIFSAEMVDNPSIKPFLGVGVWLDKLNETGGRKRDKEFIFNSNVHLEIIEDNKEIDKKTIDQEILDRVKTYKDINEVLEPKGIPNHIDPFKMVPIQNKKFITNSC